MADFWGLEAIARRMGMHHDTLMRLYDSHRFLMFKRRHAVRRRGKPRLVWYTNDELIHRWEAAQCASQWQDRKRARQEPQASRAVDEQPQSQATVGA